MKKNKFIVDLGNISLTDKQRKKLMLDLHKSVIKNIKSKSIISVNTSQDPQMRFSTNDTFTGKFIKLSTANLNVEFFNGNSGDNLTATLDRIDGSQEIKSIDFNGGTISFTNVSSDDTIGLDGFCVSKAVVTIDVPVKQNLPASFPGGNIFFIIIIE